MGLVFYDTETTGTDTYFDQILQFAAIKTDSDFNEIDRINIRCRILPHVVPAPGAMRVTGVGASQLIDAALPSHYAMVRMIRAKLIEWSPAIFVGYNSLTFDERLIRQALYKTLHNPYLTNTKGNSRSDVMRIAQACSLFEPGALKIPAGDGGRRVFKLERVAPANGFKHKNAHDAMGDVEATIHVCRLIAEKAPDVWSAFMRFSQKAAVADYIADETVFCVSDYFYGNPHSCLATLIGQNGDNKNEWYIYDLSIDPESLQPLSAAQLAVRLGRSPKPLRRLRSNGVPMLFPAEQAPDVCKGRECGLDELMRRAQMLKTDEALCERLISAFESTRAEYPPSPHVERQIYDGFFASDDEKLMEAFHEAEWPDRPAIVEALQDPRLTAIGRQLIYVERPDVLDDAIRQECRIAMSRRLLGIGEDIDWMTLPEALSELETMREGASETELVQFLRDHDLHLRRLLREARKHAA